MINLGRILIYALQGASGAVAGYITNKYAVNMLFKEYAPFKIGEKEVLPFKFGGVIKHRKEQFVEEISSLVERDIINGSTLKEAIGTKEVSSEITKIFNTFLNEALTEAFEGKNLGDIAGFDNTIVNIKKFTIENCDRIVEPIVDKIFETINLNEVLSEEQVKHIGDSLFKLICDGIDENKSIDEIIEVLYNESSQAKFSNLLDENTVYQIEKNINEIVITTIDEYFKDDNRLITSIEEIIKILNIDEITNNVQIYIKEKKLKDVINDEEIEKISQSIGKSFTQYLKSEDGIVIVKTIIKEFIDILKGIELSVYGLMNDEIGEKVTRFINEKLPVVLPYISNWVEGNKAEFDSIIEESINEGIQDMDPGIKKMIFSLVREFFLDDISAKNKVIQQIIEFIESYRMDNNEAQKLADNIVKYLKNTKIKDIIKNLEKNGIINDEIIDKISNLVSDKIANNSEKMINQFINLQKERCIGELIEYDLKELLINKKESIYSLVINEKENIKSFINDSVRNKINSVISLIIDKNIKDVISRKIVDDIKNSSNNTIKHIVINNQLTIKEYIEKGIESFINDIDLSAIAKENNEFISETIRGKVLDIEDGLFEKSRTKKISDIIRNFAKNDKRIDAISYEASKYLEDNLEDILRGKIKTIVYDNLIQLDEDEICDLAQKFMGTELQPLSIFGGILGLIGGLIFGAFSNNIGIIGSYTSVYEILGSVVLMGAIGVATNVIAIAMLFRPYKKSKVLSKIPFLRKFALGYIPAHKGDLANGIGTVIDNEILNGGKIQELFRTKKDAMHTSLMKLISNDNYKFLSESIKKSKDSVCMYFYDKLSASIKNNDDSISKNLEDSLSEIKVEKVIGKNTINNISLKLGEKKNEFKIYLVKFFERKIESDKKIVDIIPEDILENIENNIEGLLDNIIKEETNKLLSEQNIKSLVIKCNPTYTEFINKKLEDVINEDREILLRELCKSKIDNFLYNNLRYALGCKVKELLIVELDSDKTIQTMFDGNIKNIIDNNLNKITNFLVEKFSDMIAEKEYYIGDVVKSNIISRLNFIQKMGYTMAGGDRIVDKCVGIAVNKNIPLFINEKLNEVEEAVENCLRTVLYPTKLGDIKISVNEISSNEFIYNIFEGLSNERKLDNIIDIISCETINQIKKTDIKEMLNIIDLDTTEKIYFKLNEEINFAISEVRKSIEENSNELSKYFNELIMENIKNSVNNISVNNLLSGINKNSIEYTAEKVVSIILESKAINSEISCIVEEIYNNTLRKEKISSIIECNLLREDLKETLNIILQNESIKSLLELSIEKIVEMLSEEEFKVFDIQLKDDVNNIISNAILDVMIMHTKSILESLELKEITYREIQKMDPKDIHQMFESFAGEYFKKLYTYGIVGAIFGLNLWIPIIWALIEYLKRESK